MGFWRQEYWSALPFPSPVDHVLSELSTMTCLSWVALHGLAHSFIELDEAVVHVISLISFLWLWFSFCLPPRDTSLVAQRVKRLPAMWETHVRSLGWEDPLEKEMATHSSILVGEFHGQRSLVGYSARGRKEWDTTEQYQFSLWGIRIRGLWNLPDERDWLGGKLGLVLIGRAMHSKSLIQILLMGGNVFPPCCSQPGNCSLCSPRENESILPLPTSSLLPGFPVLHQLPELAQTHVHWVSDAI